MKTKKSQISLILLLALAVILLLVFPFSFGFTAFFLSKNAFVLLGTFLVVIGAIGLMFLPVPKNVAMTLLVVGVILFVLPLVFKSFAGITLGVMLGG